MWSGGTVARMQLPEPSSNVRASSAASPRSWLAVFGHASGAPVEPEL